MNRWDTSLLALICVGLLLAVTACGSSEPRVAVEVRVEPCPQEAPPVSCEPWTGPTGHVSLETALDGIIAAREHVAGCVAALGVWERTHAACSEAESEADNE